MLRLLTSVLLSTLSFQLSRSMRQWIGTLNSVCVYETERERDRDRDRAYEYMSMKEFGVFYFSHLSMVVM